MKKLKETLESIRMPDATLEDKIRSRLDSLTKPPGSLGRIEKLAVQLGLIQQSVKPSVERKVIFTFAGDHGVVGSGVSAYPQEVTAQMVLNFLKGGAAVNVLARQVNAKVVVADIGVSIELPEFPEEIKKYKVGTGTKDFTEGPAMSIEEAEKSVEAGIRIFEEEYKQGMEIAGTGDMGIGNTTSSAAIASVITGHKPEELAGKGTGIDEESLKKKISVIMKGISVNRPDPSDPLDVLSKLGGFEIGALAGVILAASAHKVPVVLDGYISGAAALIAYVFKPEIRSYTVASHRSFETGHKLMLEFLELEPLLDLDLRLGEGTGAALAFHLAEASARILSEMATFEEAGVSGKE